VHRCASRLLATATVVVLGAVLLVPTSPASAAEQPTEPDRTATVVNGPDGTPKIGLEYDLYVPDGASPADPRPAIVITNGFGGSKDIPEVTATAHFLVRQGYVVLAYTAAGFGGSGGCITLQSIDRDARGTQQLVDQVLDVRDDVLRDDAGELVLGTVGGSYGGGWQLPFAALDDRVKAAAPGRTWQLLRYSLNPNNRVVPGDPTGFSHSLSDQGVFKAQWTSLFFALGNAQPALGTGGCPEYKAATGDPAQIAGIAACPGYLIELCTLFGRTVATGEADDAGRELLDRASGASFLDVLAARKLPVLLVQGQRDTLFNPNDALTAYTRLRDAGAPAEMVWNFGGHGGYNSQPGECEVYGGGTGAPEPSPTGAGLEDCYLSLRTLDFLDRHLRDKAGSAPGFSWHRDWTTFAQGADGTFAADEQYGTAPAYPAMPSTTFTVSGSDALVPAGGAIAEATVRIVNPPGGQPASYTETSNFSGPDSSPRDPRPPSDVPGQAVSFTSAPFPADTESVGVPRATLRLSHTAPGDLFLFGKVFDVAPDGSAELIHRLVSPVRVPAEAVDEPVTMNLIGFAHRFEAGHSVRLTLSATDMAYRNSPVADVITLATGAGSTFSLPMPATAAAPGTTTTPGGAASLAPAPRPAAAAAPSGRLPATGALAAAPALGGLLLFGALALRRRRVG
jgi:ABC-2 type transport system ATP-binding protein